jgi:uncharacterized protein DUF6702
MVTRVVVLVLSLVGAIGTIVGRADAHPLHTTLAEVSASPSGGLQIVLRVFVDDFSAAVRRQAAPPRPPIVTPADSAAARYLGETLVLSDGAGHRVALEVVRMRRTDDLLWITLEARALRSTVGARLANRVLFERWADQVNIVQTALGGRRQTLLFTKRDGGAAKAI